ncbi:hypothetical protein RUM44_012748 [Polyplax serrata]|uniref:Uncharacterized protein n=1 Tax=Polyplax serrata TaxID=468196 RepID=A0ABR1BG80_POLSC
MDVFRRPDFSVSFHDGKEKKEKPAERWGEINRGEHEIDENSRDVAYGPAFPWETEEDTGKNGSVNVRKLDEWSTKGSLRVDGKDSDTGHDKSMEKP